MAYSTKATDGCLAAFPGHDMEIKFHGDWSNMQKRDINSEIASKPSAAYSQAVEVSGATRMLFVSGQLGIDSDGTVPSSVTEQARIAWRNLEAQLKAANMGLNNLVKVTMIVPDPADIPATRPVRAEVLGDRRPASTVIVAGLAIRLGKSRSKASRARELMTVAELRDIAEGLASRANRAADGKQDSLDRGRLALDKLYGYARDTLPITVELLLEDENETWADIARLANAIVTACDDAEPRCP